MLLPVHTGMELGRETFLGRLVDLQYNRNDIAFERGEFRVRGGHGRAAAGGDGGRGADRVLRGRGRSHHAVRSADRGDAGGLDGADRVSGQAVRHAAGEAEAGDSLDPRGIGRAHRLVREAGQAARSAADQDADRVRPRAAGGDWGSARESRTTRVTSPIARRGRVRTASSTSFRRISSWSSTNRTRRCRRSGGCTPGTWRGRRSWSSTASGCPARSTTGRWPSPSSRPCRAADDLRERDAGRGRNSNGPGDRSSSRSSVPPA
jgi:hypothetical protein